MKLFALLCILCAWHAVPQCAETSPPLAQREHPFLFGNKELFRQARERAQSQEWARRQLDGIVKSADETLATPLDVPEKEGQWGHHYVCKKCSTRLQTKGARHLCPNCGEEYFGWPYDQVVAGGIHKDNWNSLSTLGLAYQLTGKPKYAERARQTLLAYADRYPRFAIHDYRGSPTPVLRGARMLAQTLDEAIAAIQVAWGYDLVYDAPELTAEDKQRIENGLLREIVKTIMRNDMGVSNWQTWHNSAVASIGYCLQDADLVAHALDGPHGFRWQLKHSILPDGFWYEGSPSYHFYSLTAMMSQAEAAHFAGLNLYVEPELKGLLTAGLDYAFPDGTFPALNDSDVVALTEHAALYEIAFARYKEPRFGSVAALRGRKSREALLWGENELPKDPFAHKAGNSNFPSLGAIMLRQGEGPNALNAHLDYGPHGGAHGHYDKLGVIFFGLGEVLAPDAARVQYGSPLQAGWYKTTVAHNTIVMNGTNQESATGKLIWETWKPGLACAQATCDTCYDDTRITRTLALTPEYLLDITETETSRPATFDLAWHLWGKPGTSLPLKPPSQPVGKKDGYQHLAHVRTAETSGPFHIDLAQKRGTVRVAVADSESGTVIVGEGVANNPPTSCTAILLRRNANSAVFVAALEPARSSALLKSVEVQPGTEKDSGDMRIVVSYGNRKDHFTLHSAPEEGVTGIEMTSLPLKSQGRDTSRN